MSLPTTATFKAFAKLAGFKPSYVTQLKRDGRLLLTEDGKAVLVAESLARIEATKDPARQDVADRHAAARAMALPRPDEPDEEDPAITAVTAPYQEARARKEHYLALQAQLDYETSTRKKLDADLIEGQLSDAVTALRVRLEALPPIIAPQLAIETDEARCRVLLADHIENALSELQRKFTAMVKGPA